VQVRENNIEGELRYRRTDRLPRLEKLELKRLWLKKQHQNQVLVHAKRISGITILESYTVQKIESGEDKSRKSNERED
jgi:hypothetical protein